MSKWFLGNHWAEKIVGSNILAQVKELSRCFVTYSRRATMATLVILFPDLTDQLLSSSCRLTRLGLAQRHKSFHGHIMFNEAIQLC